jgi:hypothetical protein
MRLQRKHFATVLESLSHLGLKYRGSRLMFHSKGAVMLRLALLLLSCLAFLPPLSAEEPAEKVFSGPQPGERLTALKVRGLAGDAAGKEFDLAADSKGRPLFVIFVHERTRPSLGLARVLMNYAAKRAKDGLSSGLVFLSDDATAIENWVKVATAALPTGVPICLSTDGVEGPGAYGLNRKVALTVLIADKNKVTANFALIQPSVQADAPKIAKALVDALGGGDVPTLAELGNRLEREVRTALRPLLMPLIKLDATPEEVEKAAAAVEKFVADNDAAKKELGDIGRMIIDAGKLKDYGTPVAQEYLKKWAEKYGK